MQKHKISIVFKRLLFELICTRFDASETTDADIGLVDLVIEVEIELYCCWFEIRVGIVNMSNPNPSYCLLHIFLSLHTLGPISPKAVFALNLLVVFPKDRRFTYPTTYFDRSLFRA